MDEYSASITLLNVFGPHLQHLQTTSCLYVVKRSAKHTADYYFNA